MVRSILVFPALGAVAVGVVALAVEGGLLRRQLVLPLLRRLTGSAATTVRRARPQE